MASRVHYAMESMISELLELKKEFGERKVKNLVKKIQEFEYKSMDSLQSYIEFTCCLYKLMEKRGKKLTAITARIHGLYQKLLRNGNDPQLWVQYLNWQRDKSPKLLGKNYAKAIQLFPTSSTFWLMASKHEYTNGNWQSARVLMQRSLRFCANDEKLWLELFKLEILYVEMLAGRRKVLGIAGSINVPTFDGESSDSDQALVADSIIENGKLKLDFILAQTVFKNACRQNPSLEFVLKFLSLVLNMNLEANLNKTELLDDIYSELKQFDCDQAGTITCLRPLQVIDIPSIDYDSHDFPVKVALCVKLFKESNIALDYAKFLQHVYQSGESNLQKYCLFYLNELYVSSLNAGTLTSELILCVYQTIGDSAILDSGLKTINGDCDLLWNEKVAMVGGSGIQDLYLQNKQVRCVKLAYFDWLIENSTEQQVASFFNVFFPD